MTPLELVLSRLPGAKRNSRGWIAPCPTHDDHTPSLSINEGDDGRALVHCYAGCTRKAIVSALGLTTADLMPDKPGFERMATPTPPAPPKPPTPTPKGRTVYADTAAFIATLRDRFVALWTYQDADGADVLCVVRLKKDDGAKTFLPLRPKGDGWAVGDPDGLLPLYRLGDLGDNVQVFICEGEKCC